MPFKSTKSKSVSQSSFKSEIQLLNPLSIVDRVDSYRGTDELTDEVFKRPFEQIRSSLAKLYSQLGQKGIYVR